MLRKLVSLKSDKNNGYFTRRIIYIFDHITLTSCQNKKSFKQKSQRKLKHAFYVQQHYFFSLNSCRLWDNVETFWEPGRSEMTIWRMRIACCIPRATNTHSGYVILIDFPLQQWLHERTSVTLYAHCLSCVSFDTIRRLTVMWSPKTKCLRTDVVKRFSIYIFTKKSHYAELVGEFFYPV